MHPALEKLRGRPSVAVLITGVAVLTVACVLAALTSAVMLEAYLLALLLWLGLPLGAMGWLGVWHMTGGRWGHPRVNRALAILVRTLPVIALLFIPLLIWPGQLYPWADGESPHEATGFREHYIAIPWFILRTIVFFALWLFLAWRIVRLTVPEAGRGSRNVPTSHGPTGAITTIVYILTMSLAAIDWGMSLSGEWISTIYGLLFIVGQGLAALCAVIVLVTLDDDVQTSQTQHGSLNPDVLHDLGKLLLATVAMWTYVNFSQLLIYWSGNLPAEISWYVVRMRGFWGSVMALLIVGHFFAPLLLLLSAPAKRDPRTMRMIAMLLLVMHLVDVLWRVAPDFDRATVWPVLVDVLAMLGVGGIWLAVMLWQAAATPTWESFASEAAHASAGDRPAGSAGDAGEMAP